MTLCNSQPLDGSVRNIVGTHLQCTETLLKQSKINKVFFINEMLKVIITLTSMFQKLSYIEKEQLNIPIT